MTYVEYVSNNKKHRIVDLGESLNQEFIKLIEHYTNNVFFDFVNFEKEAYLYFDLNIDNWGAHDRFFENFTGIWQWFLKARHYVVAEEVWQSALTPAINWEKNNTSKRIHKGTPYYFNGGTLILKGEIDRGFLLMHQALDEDIKSHGNQHPATPATAFATLDYQEKKQALRNTVREAADFFNKFICDYQQTRNMTLTIDQLRSKFLQVIEHRDTVFLLVFVIFKLKSLFVDVERSFRLNDFAGLLELGVLFDLCLVIDSVIKHVNSTQWKPIDHAAYLSSKCHFTLDKDHLKTINEASRQDFSGVINALILNTYVFDDNTTLTQSESDIALSYVIRNFSAHNIESFPIIHNSFEDISQRIANVLFFAIEHLY